MPGSAAEEGLNRGSCSLGFGGLHLARAVKRVSSNSSDIMATHTLQIFINSLSW